MMEHRCIKAHKNETGKSHNKFGYDVRHRVTLEYFHSKSSLISTTCPECQLSLSIKKKNLELVHSCKISKGVTSFNEQYLSHCLELVQISAAKAASNLSFALSPSKSYCLTESIFPSPRNAFSFSSEVISVPSVRRILGSSCETSTSGFSYCSSPMLEMEDGMLKHGSESDNILPKDRSLCTSSVVSTSSDRSTCTWPAVSHGMLQCAQRNGISHFAFSMDNKREVYTTNSGSSDGSSHDWNYFIHLSTSNLKEHKGHNIDSNLVGRINVSTSYKFSSDGLKIMETEFILYGDDECEQEQSCSSNEGKHRRLPGKVSKLLRPLHLLKHRRNTNTWGTGTSLELSSLAPDHNEDCDSDHIGHPNLLESDIPSNFELAAIVVKEQVEVIQQETEMGGWGLSFLKRATKKLETERKSTVVRGMDVLIPSGVHGGPITGNAGPSSLIERWRNEGQCDCGGWDTGCPLTVLNTKPNGEGVSNSLDLFLKGDKGCPPWMKMVNIQNGLYSIDYRPRLSALQCFSIAVAAIHSRSLTPRLNTQTS